MKTIFIHIGYHKTATTFLQRVVYPELKNVTYIKKTREVIKRYNQFRTKALSDKELKRFRGFINDFDEGKPILISHEGFSGNPLYDRKTKKQFDVLEDLREAFPAPEYDVHIIVGIREQVSLLTSLYVQHVKMGGILNGPEFIQQCKQNRILENFCFYHALQKIEELFGEDHIYVMVYEYFKKNMEEELFKLLTFMGEPEIPTYQDDERLHNKSLGKLQLAIARRLNHLFKTPIHPDGYIPVVEAPIIGHIAPRYLLHNKITNAIHYKRYLFPISLQSKLKQKYEEGNQKLVKRYNLDLPENYL